MAARIVKLNTRRQRLRAEQAAQLRQLVIEFEGLDADAAGRIVAAIDRETAAEKGWTFVQLNAEQNAFVVGQLLANSRRPRLAAKLWAALFLHMRLDTNEIVASREELAAEVGAHPDHVSAVMSELVDRVQRLIPAPWPECLGARRRRWVPSVRPGPLVRMRAVVRRQEGRRVRWFLNPLVGTGISGAIRDKAQAEAPKLEVLPGGKALA